MSEEAPFTINPRLAKALAWAILNPNAANKWHRSTAAAKRTSKYSKARKARDPSFRAMQACRARLKSALKRTALAVSSRELIGCSPPELRLHLESLFAVGMSWDNYGKWHIDHIRPCCSFDFTKPGQAEQCFHFSNLQPLWAVDNFKKSGN